MKAVYVDTSVLVSLYFEEETPQNESFKKILNSAEEVLSSSLIESEFLSVLSREKLAFSEGVQFLRQVSLVLPDRSLTPEFQRIFSTGFLRGADAHHLACALYLDPTATELVFLTADLQQKDMAKQLNFAAKITA